MLQLRLFFTALMFLTRVPIPGWVGHDPAWLNACTRYFPLVGLLVGILIAGAYTLLQLVWPAPLALLLALVFGVLLTGAFHEDGFADFCDGFGGGWEREQVLRIMKDSRLGTYGTIGLLLLMAVKFTALMALGGAAIIALIVAHSWSRLVAVSVMRGLIYVRDDHGKSKPLATELSARDLGVMLVYTSPLALLLGWHSLAVIVALLLLRWVFMRYLQRRIGGYTGDCLGALQQLAEVSVYLILLAS